MTPQEYHEQQMRDITRDAFVLRWGYRILDGCLWFMGALLVGWLLFGFVLVATGGFR
jgi:hypothetical protein